MSYCRWSSEGNKSDVYCYENVSRKWITHVAGNKLINGEHYPIGLPHDGETFDDDSIEDMLKTLLMLRGLGYHVPQFAIESIEEEIKQGEQHADK